MTRRYEYQHAIRKHSDEPPFCIELESVAPGIEADIFQSQLPREIGG